MMTRWATYQHFKLLILLCTALLFPTVVHGHEDPECFPFEPLPNVASCWRALDLLRADMLARYPDERLITRHEFRPGDYVVPRSYANGQGDDRCVIAIDVNGEYDYDFASWFDFYHLYLKVLRVCLHSKGVDRGPGRAWIKPKKVVYLKITSELEIGGTVVTNDTFATI